VCRGWLGWVWSPVVLSAPAESLSCSHLTHHTSSITLNVTQGAAVPRGHLCPGWRRRRRDWLRQQHAPVAVDPRVAGCIQVCWRLLAYKY
jgi:hypothetical protein